MFYNASIDNKLRFGDVVKGYLSVILKLSKPFGNAGIEIQTPQYSVVLDPCCEIGDGMISLSPLEEINPQLLDIPYLSKDRTLLNRIGIAKDFFHPIMWNNLPDETKTEALVATPEYGWKPYFVYEGNPVFPEYTIERQTKYNEVIDPKSKLPKYDSVKQPNTFKIRDRMISFKTVYRVNCQGIVKPEKATNETILGSIVLQLSAETRELLRLKMAYYFGKPSPEDSALLSRTQT
jgi:hypothetical protein